MNPTASASTQYHNHTLHLIRFYANFSTYIDCTKHSSYFGEFLLYYQLIFLASKRKPVWSDKIKR